MKNLSLLTLVFILLTACASTMSGNQQITPKP